MEEESSPLGPVLASPDRTPSCIDSTTLAEKLESSPPWEDEVDEWEKETKPRFPSTTVDAYSIGNVMATRLAICLLGFVLFLKSQVPVPVSQLVKMRSGDSSNNKRSEKLLASLDVLSEHLGSTFTALAVAFSRATDASRASHNPDLSKAHLAIVLGPSLTSFNAARARIILELDGVRVPYGPEPRFGVDPCIVDTADDTSGYPRPSPLIGTSDGNDLEELCGDAETESQPHSHDEWDLEESEIDSEEGEITDDDDSSFFEDTEADLCDAERKLARALAITNSDPETGLALDIRPTYTHVLLRAPRSFSHPSWMPRQNLGRDLDPLMYGFSELTEVDQPSAETSYRKLNDSTGEAPSGREATDKKTTKEKASGGVKTDYVRVQSQGAAAGDPFNVAAALVGNDEGDGGEMIWWSWDGKLEGFTEI